MKDILLFDLDGTLFNTKPGIVNCVQYALADYGIFEDNPDNLEKFIGPPLHQSFQMFYGFDEEKSAQAVSKYRERYKEEGIYECAPYDGIKELLKDLREKGKILGVATSKPEIFAKRILDKFEFSQYFTQITGSHLDNTRSKKTEVIEEALSCLGASNKREHVLMIGDREHDIIGAKEAQLSSVGVYYGFAKAGELEAAGAEHIVRTVPELHSLLLSL